MVRLMGMHQGGFCFCVTCLNLQSPCHRQKYHFVCYDNGQVVLRDSETLNYEGLMWACLKMGIFMDIPYMIHTPLWQLQ